MKVLDQGVNPLFMDPDPDKARRFFAQKPKAMVDKRMSEKEVVERFIPVTGRTPAAHVLLSLGSGDPLLIASPFGAGRVVDTFDGVPVLGSLFEGPPYGIGMLTAGLGLPATASADRGWDDHRRFGAGR